MAWNLGENLDEEAERAIITGKLGAGRAASLFPRYPLDDDFAPILRRGDVVGKAFRSVGQPWVGPTATGWVER
jgi:hypothetical protein